jgi:hypothetical protein
MYEIQREDKEEISFIFYWGLKCLVPAFRRTARNFPLATVPTDGSM